MSHLARRYEKRKSRGVRSSKRVSASTFVVRRAPQALEKFDVVEHDEEIDGQRIFPGGRRDLDRMPNTMCF
ncbi:hypothetical protein RRF57_004833 [Xylaria bambusicola]|uniref:Uncharacterized protein n=1 Tax=Xylaria bambusicola TaxID=326684 RepID=A0AAN7UKS9_9PEZI